MITPEQFEKELNLIIRNAVREDIGDGDHTSQSCIPRETEGRAKLLVKDTGIIAGVEFAKKVFNYVDPELEVETIINDGSPVKHGDIVFYVSGRSQSILQAENSYEDLVFRRFIERNKNQSFGYKKNHTRNSRTGKMGSANWRWSQSQICLVRYDDDQRQSYRFCRRSFSSDY